MTVVRVFVSYAGTDRSWAEWVGWQLEHAGLGISVELDCWDWRAGDSFVEKINSALNSCDLNDRDMFSGLLSNAALDEQRMGHGAANGNEQVQVLGTDSRG